MSASPADSATVVWDICRSALPFQDGWVAVFQVFVDESGTHDGSPALIVAAYVGRPADWRKFTKSWNFQKKPIGVFHAVDCANLRNEFDGWDVHRRNIYVSKLLPVIARSNIRGIVQGIVMKDFNEAMKENKRLAEIFGNPYQVCFLWALQFILSSAFLAQTEEKFAIIHECNQYTGDALAAYDYIKKNADWGDNLVSIAFADKKEFVPLQAADVLAYEANKRLRNVREQSGRRSFAAIRPSISSIKFIDKKHMPQVIKELENLRSEIIANRLSQIGLTV